MLNATKHSSERSKMTKNVRQPLTRAESENSPSTVRDSSPHPPVVSGQGCFTLPQIETFARPVYVLWSDVCTKFAFIAYE